MLPMQQRFQRVCSVRCVVITVYAIDDLIFVFFQQEALQELWHAVLHRLCVSVGGSVVRR
jgi:hypothetical protein